MRRAALTKAILVSATMLAGALPSLAAAAEAAEAEIVVTGSLIKRNPNDSALPLTIISNEELTREGINSPEQLVSLLSTNGNGPDNLASNADVVGGAQRGTNGLSSANLRGQGAAATLVLLNGRRVAAHGLQGSAVDVNQIPFAAIERIEILKDGASAIYGTDAIGGVMNFITKKNFQGLTLNGSTDATTGGGGNIYRLSATAGYGDLATQGFNIMATVGRTVNEILQGSQRSFVNGNQPNRGLSIDTRGTPIATIFPNGVNALFAPQGSLLTGATLVEPGTTNAAASAGINFLDLPGGAGCSSMDGGMAYDEQLWANPNARLACAWDTGRAVVLQQPINTLTYYGRATVRAGSHELFAEITGSNAKSAKIFSNNQYSGNATTTPLYYPLNATTAATYNDVYDRLAAVFPTIGAVGDRIVDAVGNYGRPIAYRWRCIACGNREYKTTTDTFRVALGAEGPLFEGWDYRAGGSYAKSESSSLLGDGYHYRGIFSSTLRAQQSGIAGAVSGGLDTRAPTAPGATAPGIVGLLNSGILNPFSVTQTPAALAALNSISAKGTTLYGGRYEVYQADAAVTGGLFDLPGGEVKLAIGADYRRERYSFNGSASFALTQPEIFNVADDNDRALAPVSRDVKAVYGELLIPVFEPLEITVAGRYDNYTGFGGTFNPKISGKFQPVNWLMFRGSYNTGFRVPSFNQIFNPVTVSPNPGNTLIDPTTCSLAGPNPAVAGCAAITPDTATGGNLNLGPETSKQFSLGVVFQPARRFSASFDFWSIDVDNVIGALTIQQLLANQALFPNRIFRTGGIITALDLRNDNIGSRRTQGLEVSLRGGVEAFGGVLSAGLDGTYMLKRRERFLANTAFGPSLIGVFTYTGDLALKWKHNAFITWANDTATFSVSQIYRDGYTNQALPGIAAGTVVRPDYNPRVKPYIIYNLSAAVRIQKQLTLTFGVKNIFNTDPPFAITYDSNFGSGSSWEPRVADPRGRSITMAAEVKF
ncbi:TonB-dependent receptor domain-containing protein [Sphingomonas sp. SUN039]|uniref:TonB-dependent receptor domain-containing protein n=1 Tax=Sphingomonas sp. SUN039 TaxID=2937787 RepID=UPI002164097B|nr:TonB-dependent receptor [Sphingomonas sp. SUN039]UVO54616.1 TonB-dependent receptor [Sphingomonas sp. SUN039]